MKAMPNASEPTAAADEQQSFASAWPWLLLAGVVVVIDQVSKWVVVQNMALHDRVDVWSFFAWVRWHNTGAAFSMLNDAGGWQRWVFIALAIGFAVFLLYELRRLPVGERVMGWVYGLILGGALGNLIDRALNGYVVDFLLFHYEQHYFPAFNVADSALFCGAALWILTMIRDYRQERAGE